MARLTDAVAQLRTEHGRRFLKYCGVSAFNVLMGQGLLLFFHSVVGMPGWAANMTAIIVGTGPAYLLSRRWVWEKKGNHSVREEMLPFWGLNLMGFLLSTLFVGIADVLWHNALFLVAASICAWGLVWVLKYVTMDKMVFRRKSAASASV